MKIPKTPFSTHLSGSAKETELRLRNIFQWKKKRPPIIILIVAVLVVALCGGLVGFTSQEGRSSAPVAGKNGVLAVKEIPGGVVYATRGFGSADLYWLPNGVNEKNAKLVRENIPNVIPSTLALTCEGDILRLEYIQFDALFEWDFVWDNMQITTRYRVAENMPPKYIDSRGILVK